MSHITFDIKMSLNIEVNHESDEKCVAHLLPCKISHNGPANVTSFFSPYIEKKDSHDKGNSWKYFKIETYQIYQFVFFFSNCKLLKLHSADIHCKDKQL